jgi:O-antigen/teichoic acid export membrane protein
MPEALRSRLLRHLAEPQHRTTYLLLLNTATTAATGLVFWVILARLDTRTTIGLSYTIISLGTLTAILAKGGLDIALLRAIPLASRAAAVRLLRFGAVLGGALAFGLAGVLAVVAWSRAALPELVSAGWALVAAIGLLMVITWLQDAYFLAEGRPGLILHRNIAASASRLLLVLPVLLWTVPHPPAVAWALALCVSAAAGVLFAGRLPERAGRDVAGGEFMRSANRNLAGSAAEFLPGLLLAPIVLALQGPEAAATFGVCWTIALMLFLVASAISRSALAEMVRDHSMTPLALRRAGLQITGLVLPAGIVIALFAPLILSVFGPEYARDGTVILRILAASCVFVAPASLYLAHLRAHERSVPLVIYPVTMVMTLALLAPLLAGPMGTAGIALAWLVAQVPWAVVAVLHLRRESQEVMRNAPAVGGRPHVE